jgi:hypothetical protein
MDHIRTAAKPHPGVLFPTGRGVRIVQRHGLQISASEAFGKLAARVIAGRAVNALLTRFAGILAGVR